MSYDIENKVALITGANRGIGKAIVESFMKHGVAKIYAGVRSETKAAELIEEFGEKITPITVDYSDASTITQAAKTAADVDIVVSNAGILEKAPAISEKVFESFERELEINVYGLLRMAHAFAPVLKANGGGAFVQLNSIASLASFGEFSSYCASKAAAYSFTQGLKTSFAEQGTVLLSVHPGPIATDMATDAGFEDMGDPASMVSEGIVKSLKAGDFHLFPDTMAKDFEKAYAPFAKGIIEAEAQE